MPASRRDVEISTLRGEYAYAVATVRLAHGALLRGDLVAVQAHLARGVALLDATVPAYDVAR